MWARRWRKSSRRISKDVGALGSAGCCWRSNPSGPTRCVAEYSIYGVAWAERFRQDGRAEPLTSLGFPGSPQHADLAGKILADGGLDGFGNGWAEIQPGELVHRHPLPAGKHRIARVEHGRGPLPYLCLKNEVDDMAVGRQALADDDERPHARVEAQLFLELAAQRRVERFVALQPPAGEHPVALATLAVLDEQDLVLADDDGRHAQLRRHGTKRLYQRRETDQRCAHRSGGRLLAR